MIYIGQGSLALQTDFLFSLQASDLGGTRHVAGLLPVRTEVNQHLLFQIIMQK